MGRKLQGKELKVVSSVRIEPEVLGKIEEAYGSLSAFIYEKIKRDHKYKKAKDENQIEIFKE